MFPRETLRRKDFWPLIGGKAMFSALVEQSSRLSGYPQPNKRVPTNFLLIDTFTNELVKPQLESPLDLETKRYLKLEDTIHAQLEAALREHLRTPYHTDANELDWDKYAAGGFKVFHRHYSEKDLRDHCQEAVDANTGVKRERYAREKEQLDQLYTQKIEPELQDFKSLAPAKASILSWEVRQAYQLDPDEEIFVGQKHGLVMPANEAVYPEGWSYVNLHQLVYLPKQRRLLVTIDQFFADLSYEQHRAILNRWQPESIAPKKPLTEKLLMETVITLPESVKTSPAFDVFIDLVKLLDTQQDELGVRQKQQYSHGFVEKSSHTLRQTAAFLTQILIIEYRTCLDHPENLNTLSQRLNIAFELAAHPLLSGRDFAYQASLDTYREKFINPWLDKKSKNLNSPEQIFQRLKQPDQLSRSRSGRIDQKVAEQRNQVLITISLRGYPGILSTFSSQAQCAVGSLGGLTRMQGALNSSLAQSVMGGRMVSFSELQQLVGNRAEKFHHGNCVNPDCHHMQELHRRFGTNIPTSSLPYVGECNLCIGCELQYQRDELGKTTNNDPDNDEVDRCARKLYNSASDAVEDLTKLWINGSDFPLFLCGGDQVLH